MLARYLLSSYARPSVSLSQAGNVSKRLNAGSRKQRHTIAQGLWFSEAKIIGEILTGSSPTMAPNRGGVGSKFKRLFPTNISETVQDRDIVTMER